MSQQGPVLIVSATAKPSFATLLDETKLFPVVVTDWNEAGRAIEQVKPAAIIAATQGIDYPVLAALAKRAAARAPYLPLIAVDPATALPDTAIAFFQKRGLPDRLIARLNACLRVRALHATVMRRLVPPTPIAMTDIDPVGEATTLLIGRGGAYPALSVALGERAGVVGALSIEAAAKHLSSRDIDGIVLAEGFTPRVMDAFLTVLTEDVRFRPLPAIVVSSELTPRYDLPNLEIVAAGPARIADVALPLIRQHAFEARLGRTLRAIDAKGLIDARTGLLTKAAFDRDFATTVYQTAERGGTLSVARFSFDDAHPRAQFDGARIISKLMRQADFGAVQDDKSIIVVFTGTDLRNAHAITRRLASVMRHTHHGRRDTRAEPVINVATLLPGDSAGSLLARLNQMPERAAS
ncbi:GGDEF domain-containing protein [Bradyrhizobium sp. ISRA443]|uniref:GGDEF domain-containing protein n=1 Tax=unclassified Bradyrhizobium TaxID=2631580 RepID=UPI00247857EC|nr:MULTISPECIES: GGDEF domain-containing protein [unclassified Bradyrhizobium]WGR92091.1 GGDEF domain-containing protein [Bradyrhizobium sp. ISRA435]WGR96334.1 GGDEF domain-containing protein [Bradyrhizobium sp. ISRA436]WGS09439.1 GGDEF domain-containing protein [Bradyrhizobium sp. ISRA437]WGS16328.1 GGDEF domain-containing protein [Bradyrhizobium sp. ISRA443]